MSAALVSSMGMVGLRVGGGTEGTVGDGVSGRDRHVASKAVDAVGFNFKFLESSQRPPLLSASLHVPPEVSEQHRRRLSDSPGKVQLP